MNRFYEMARRIFAGSSSCVHRIFLMWSTTILVFALGNAAAFIVCAILWKNGQGGLTIGSIYLVFYYTASQTDREDPHPMEDLQRQMPA